MKRFVANSHMKRFAALCLIAMTGCATLQPQAKLGMTEQEFLEKTENEKLVTKKKGKTVYGLSNKAGVVFFAYFEEGKLVQFDRGRRIRGSR